MEVWKAFADELGVAGELDHSAVRGDGFHLETLGLKPELHGVDVLLRGTEHLADLGVGEPLVIVGRGGIRELLEVELSVGLGVGIAVENQLEVVEGCGVLDRAAVVGGGDLWPDVAAEGDEFRLVDVAEDWLLLGGEGRNGCDEKSKHPKHSKS